MNVGKDTFMIPNIQNKIRKQLFQKLEDQVFEQDKEYADFWQVKKKEFREFKEQYLGEKK